MSNCEISAVGERLFRHAAWDGRIFDYATLSYSDIFDDIDNAVSESMTAALSVMVHMGFVDEEAVEIDDLNDEDYSDVLISAYKIVLTNLRAACMQRIQAVKDSRNGHDSNEIDHILESYDKLHGRVMRAYHADPDIVHGIQLCSYNIGFDEICSL